MKAALIVNPIAGQGRSMKLLPKAVSLLEADYEVLVLQTKEPGEGRLLCQRALEKMCDLVIVLGGDGTISEVVNTLAETSVPLGVIPCGTANVFANELQIPSDVKKACKIIADAKVEIIDLGKAGGQFFVLMAGIGFDAQVVQEVNLDVKRMLKDLAYVLTGVKTVLTYKSSRMTVIVDDREPREGYFVVVGNARYYAGRFSITTLASIKDGFLDICIFKKGDTKSFTRYITGVLLGKHTGFKDVEYLKGKTVQIESEQPTLVQADGELIGRLPMSFSVVPRALSVFSPS